MLEGSTTSTGEVHHGYQLNLDFHLHILRVEGGHRVVDIDQEVFPTLNVPSGEPGRGGSKINGDDCII